GYTGTRTTASAVAFNQGKAKAWIKDSAITSWEYNISTPEQLVACVSLWSEGFNSTVNLLADLDMSGVSYPSGHNFGGTFNGNNHKIYNLVCEKDTDPCFIRNLVGEINNLVLGSYDGTTYDGISEIVLNHTEVNDSWHYAAPIIRLKTDANIENVVNFIPVSVKAASVVKSRIGGLVATVSTGPSSITGCANRGAVSNNATAPCAAGVVGGVIGMTEGSFVVNIDDTANYGDITVANDMTTYIGGIIATDAAGGSFTNCTNAGNISVTSTGSLAMCIGGILGSATNSSLSRCHNSGSINSVCDGELKVGGILGRAYSGGSLTNCVNEAGGTITFNPSTFTAQAYVGGIVGNAPADNKGTLTISLCKNYANLSSAHRNVAYIAGIAGFLNLSSGVFIIDDSTNYGDISRTATAKGTITNVCVAGIAANPFGTDGSRIKGCVNEGRIYCSTNVASTTIRMGGIGAWVQQYTNVNGCVNRGDIIYEMGDVSVAGSTIHEGGIVGHLVKGSSASGCSNSGSISSDRKQVNRVGGIIGTCNSSSIYECTNTGSVNVNVPSGTTLSNWQGIGGIAGFAEGTTNTRIIDNCINRGAVSASVNTTVSSGRYGVGGIIGEPYSAFTITNNKTYGAISAENTNGSTPYTYVGGIMGFDGDATASSITDNSNYGEITNLTANAGYSAAGGLFGKIAKASGVTGSSFGTVVGACAGAVAGVNSTTIAVTICYAVEVNGVTKPAASADEALWLCPSNSGTISLDYVPHNAGE
ncbi:MAG: hypothetical protein J6W82_10460, partial [Bacteroidales bacterium]|nr:hypothetical protein [Bacteroidales bacterium]